MANTLRFKRGLVSTIPTALAGEPLFTTDTFDLYIGNGTTNTRFQKYIASGTTSQLLRGDGSLLTMPIVLTSPANGQVLKYNGTSWVNDSDAGITGSGANGQVTFWNSASTITGSNNLFWDATNSRLGIGTNTPETFLHVNGSVFIGGVSTIGLQLENALTSIPSSNVRSIIANTSSSIVVAGALLLQPRTGVAAPILFSTEGSEKMRLTSLGRLLLGSTSDNGLRFQVTGDGFFSGSVGVGTSTFSGYNLVIGKNISGGASIYSVSQSGTVQTDVTTNAGGFINFLNTAASTNVTSYYHYRALQNTIGASTTIANQFGYHVADLTTAVYNYAFHGNVSSGSNKWNLYMNGTAANYLAGSLGIGVVSPTIRLQVENNENAGNGIFTRNTNSGNAATSFLTTQSNAGLLSLIAHSTTHAVWANTALISTSTGLTGGLVTFVGAGNYDVWTNNTFRMRLDASGNLGLGVTPSATSGSYKNVQNGLATMMGSTSDPSAYWSANATFNSGWKYIANGVSSRYEQALGGHYWFNAASGTAGNAISFTQAMTLHSTGNLAIGTGGGADAGFRLDVNGTMRVSGASTFSTSVSVASGVLNQGYLLTAAGTTALTRLQMGTAVTLFSNNYNAFSPASQDNNTIPSWQIRFGGGAGADFYRIERSPAGSTTMSQFFNLDGTGAATFSSSVTGASFNGTTNNIFSTGGTEKMRIDSSGQLGLGAVPYAWGGSYKSFDFLFGSIANTNAGNVDVAITQNAFFNGTNWISKYTGASKRYVLSDGGHIWFNGASATSATAITMTQAMTLDASGRLGIGLTAPTERLVVRAIGNAYANSAALSIENSNGANKTYITNAGGNFYISNSTTTDQFVLYTTGNLVLSGTSDTGERLQVNGTMRVSGASTFNANVGIGGTPTAFASYNVLGINGTAGGLIELQTNGTSTGLLFSGTNLITLRASTSSAIRFETNGNNERMRISSAGDVGIGTSSPAYKLDVTGEARVSNAIAIGTTPDTNKPFKILKNINGTVGINFENTSTGSLAFSAIQMGTDVSGGTKFTNLVYASSGVTASGVYNPDGTSLINNGSGGLNFLGTPIRFYTGGSNGVLRYLFDNEGAIQYTTTAPTTNAVDGYKQYSADVVAGNAAPHFRTENGAVIKLYQETTAVGNSIISLGGGNAVLDDTTFDGYTLRQIVKALRNQGILA